MVESENEDAVHCYQNATSVVTINDFEVASHLFESCNVALIELGLSDEDRAATFVNRGILHAASGSLAEALSDYEEAHSLHPTLAQVFINRGFVYHFENQLDQALSDYNRALELDIQSKYLAYFARAIVYEEKNLLDQAIDDYKNALEHRPSWMPAEKRLQWVLDSIDGIERIQTPTYEIVYMQ